MFEQATLTSVPASKRVWTTLLGIAGQALLVTFAIVAPMLFPQALPRAAAMAINLVAPVPPPPPVKRDVVRRAAVVTRLPRTAGPVYEPPAVPQHPPSIVVDEPPAANFGVVGGIGDRNSNGREGGVPGGINDFLAQVQVPPPRVIEVPRPVQVKPPAVTPILRVSQGVQMARLIHRVDPVYPALARNMHVQGTVELVGVVGIDGHMRQLRVVSGHPLLAPAALKAVSQWVYEPTQLNREPVEVEAPISVHFLLN